MGKEKEEFVVKDRRKFYEEKEQDKTTQEQVKPDVKKEEQINKEKDGDDNDIKKETTHNLPEINFSTFVFSLNSSALVHLGILADPASNKSVKDLDIAKQTIDILGMLDEKTKGNLTKDEDNLLKSVLYNLRMIYIKEKS